MALNQYGLGILFTAKDMASGVVEKVGNSVDATSKKAQQLKEQFWQAGKKVASGTAMMAGGLKALGGLHSTVKEFAGFQAVVKSAAAIAGASSKGYESLFKAAKQAGIETMFSPRQAAQGLRVLAQAGLNVQDSIKALIPALKLATASFGELGPEQTAGLVTVAMKTFGIEADKVGTAVGRMVHAANTAKMSIGDLQLGLAGVSRGSIALKQSLSETMISLGMVKNAGFRTQRAATQLAMAMARLASPKTQKKLEKFGITVADSTGKFRPFLSIVQDVSRATADMTDKKRAAYLQDVFGQEALGGLMAIMKQLEDGIKTSTGETVKGAMAIEHLRRGMEGAGGAADKMSKTYLATMEGQFKLMKGSLDTLKIAIGGLFVRTFLPVVQALTKGLNKMIGVIEAMPRPIKDLIGTLAPLAATAVVIAGIVKAAKGLMGMMVAARAMSAMGAATSAAGGAATGSMVAFGGFGQNMVKSTTKTGLFTRTIGRLGKAMNSLPIIGVAASLGVWIGKTIASYSWIAKEIKMLEKYNAELTVKIKLGEHDIKTTRTLIRLARSENEEILKIVAGIKTRKDAEKAIFKIRGMLKEQSAKVLLAESKAAELKAKAQDTGKIKDIAAARLAANRFKMEKAAFETMAKTRERAVGKLTEFTINQTKKGTKARFNALQSMGLLAAREEQERRRAVRAAVADLIAAEKEGNHAVINLRKKTVDQTVLAQQKAELKMRRLEIRGIGAGAATGLGKVEAYRRYRRGIRRRGAGITAPAAGLAERIATQRATRVGAPVPTEGFAGLISRPKAIIRATQVMLAKRMAEMVATNKEINKRLIALNQPMVVNVTMGDKTIATAVDRDKNSSEEKKGGVTVRTKKGKAS